MKNVWLWQMSVNIDLCWYLDILLSRAFRVPLQYHDSMSSIGPHIPEHLLPTVSATTENDAAESDEDDYTPALPPELAAARKATGPSSQPTTGPSTRHSPSPPPPRRVVGPAFPTARPKHDVHPNSDSDSDSDADVGPQPLPANVPATTRELSGVEEFLEREARRRKNVEEAKQPKKLVREEWMLVPPKAGDLLGCASLSHTLSLLASALD